MDTGPLRTYTSQCNRCKHSIKGTCKCEAFPAGIPNEIVANDFDHRNPYPGDHGIRFEPKLAVK